MDFKSLVCAALISLLAHPADAIHSRSALGLKASPLRLKGGAMFWGIGTTAPKAWSPMPIAPVEELIASRISGADFIDSAVMGSLGWRLVLGGSFLIFFVCTSIPGRLDTKLGKPKKEDMRFFTPSPWAFAIWGPIFLGEMAMAASVALAPGSMAGTAGTGWLQEMAPSYAAAALAQALWCASFRQWALNKLWIPASLLTLAAVGLFSAQGVISRAISTPGHVSVWGHVAASVPISLHFGWITCAAALSWNNYLNRSGASRSVQLTTAIATCYGAAAILGHVSFWGRNPIPALVSAWALWAVSTGHEVLRGAVDALSLDTLNLTARAMSGVSLLAAAATVLRKVQS